MAPKKKALSNLAILRLAIEASGQSARAFGLYVLEVDERTVRRWLGEERPIPGPVRQLCRIIIADPGTVSHLDPAA